MPAISQITLDHPVTMADGVAYGLVVARPTEITAILPLETIVGTSRTVTLSTPIDDTDSSAPVAGDHVSVGVLGLETLRCLVESIEPAGGDTAQLTLIPEAPAVHTAGDTLPDFEAGVTPQAALDPPIVLAVSSDEASIIRSQNGDIQARVVFDLAPTSVDGVSLMVLYRPANTDGNWSTATVQDQSARQVCTIVLMHENLQMHRVINVLGGYMHMLILLM